MSCLFDEGSDYKRYRRVEKHEKSDGENANTQKVSDCLQAGCSEHDVCQLTSIPLSNHSETARLVERES